MRELLEGLRDEVLAEFENDLSPDRQTELYSALNRIVDAAVKGAVSVENPPAVLIASLDMVQEKLNALLAPLFEHILIADVKGAPDSVVFVTHTRKKSKPTKTTKAKAKVRKATRHK